MSQIPLQGYTELCNFCGNYFPSTHIFFHTNLHIKESNTPIAILEANRYNLQLTNKYMSFTTYGRFAMLKKFIDIELPGYDIFKKCTLNADYNTFLEEIEELRNLYYSILYSEEKDFTSEIGCLFDECFHSCMAKLMKCINVTCMRLFSELVKSLQKDIEETKVQISITFTDEMDFLHLESQNNILELQKDTITCKKFIDSVFGSNDEISNENPLLKEESS